MIRVVFLRHGQSQWNKLNKFTGWTDVDLTKQGIHEAVGAASLLRSQGFTFDEAHTSLLKRAIHTLWIVLDKMDLAWIPISRTWRLNERHYGALQGINKKEAVELFGEEQVHIWRRSWDVAPPALSCTDERHPHFDPRYTHVSDEELPNSESLELCTKRALPYWYETIIPELKKNKQLLIVASGNSIRSLIKVIDNISDKDIANLNIPTAIPLVYELDEKNNFRPIKHYYLGDQEALKKAIEGVKNQTKS